MAAVHSPPSNAPDAFTPLTRDELSEAQKIEVYDREGKTQTLGGLMEGKRSLLVFTRHFCTSMNAGDYSLYRKRGVLLTAPCQGASTVKRT